MKRASIIFFICLLVASKSIGQGKKTNNKVVLVAWNEDTAYSFKFVILKGGRFVYIIEQKDSSQNTKKHSYSGKVQTLKDCINLIYDKGICPENATTYLIVEVSGYYLIQNFSDDRKRVFMRISKAFDFYTAR